MTRALVIAVALFGAACRDDELRQLEDVKAEICACKTVECGEAAMKKVPPTTRESTHRSQQLAKSIMDCLAKLYAEKRPSTDPDEPQPPEPAAEPPATTPGSSAPASAKRP